MSLDFCTTDGQTNHASFLFPPTEGVNIAGCEIPLRDFRRLSTHFLSGGFFGWGEGVKTPESVNEALNFLFGIYEKIDGEWTRKIPT